MDLEQRKQEILGLVVEQYIETAEPVGSSSLLDHNSLTISAATVRNELRALEFGGYLTHPHTSAGRMPTAQGYQYYVERLLTPASVSDEYQRAVEEILSQTQDEAKMKAIAKFTAEHLGCAIIISLGKHHIYYTGMSQLFSQPEFKDAGRTIQVSQMFDHCDVNVPRVLEEVTNRDVHVFIGEHNPLGANCGMVASRLGQDALIMALGPMRMPYAKLVPTITYIQSLFL